MIIAIVAGLLAFLATRFRPGASRRASTTTVTTVVCLALGAVTGSVPVKACDVQLRGFWRLFRGVVAVGRW